MIKRILITAGPTREMMDPVRFLSNLSTGEMGYALARCAKKQGYEVTLISGPTALRVPRGIHLVTITTAHDLKKACEHEFPKHDVLIMSAAVCDFTTRKFHPHKIHRTRTKELHLKRTPDIVAGLARHKGTRLVIGFCLETEDWIHRAQRKLKRKNLDGIVANFYHGEHYPFGRHKIKTAFLDRKGNMVKTKRQSKTRIAQQLLGWIRHLEEKRSS